MSDSLDPNAPVPAASQERPKWHRAAWRRLRQLRTFAAGITIGVLVLFCVGLSESALRSHETQYRAKTALREINESLALALDRREDLCENVMAASPASTEAKPKSQATTPRCGPQDPGDEDDRRREANRRLFPSYENTPKGLETYRRAASAELYGIDQRIAGMLGRGKDLVEGLQNVRSPETRRFSDLCGRDRGTRGATGGRPCPTPDKDVPPSWLDGVFGAVAIPNSYSHSVFHVGSLGLIFFGYLAIGAGILSVLGALIGIAFPMLNEFVANALKTTSASIGPLVAGVVGAGAVAAGIGAASVAGAYKPEIVSGGPGTVLVDTCRRTASCSGEARGEEQRALLDDQAYTGDQYNYANGGSSQSAGVEDAIAQLAKAVESLKIKDPQVVRVPTPDPVLASAITEAGKTVGGSISRASKATDERLNSLLIELGHVAAEMKNVRDKQAETIYAVKQSADQTESAVKKVNDTTAKLVPVADNTLCQNQWQEAVNSRNGFQRFWNIVSGNGGNPCKPSSAAASPAISAAVHPVR